jgi:hypothetical protein
MFHSPHFRHICLVGRELQKDEATRGGIEENDPFCAALLARAGLLLAAIFVFLLNAAAQAQVTLGEQKPIPKWKHAVSLGAAIADISVVAYGKHQYSSGFVESDVLAKTIVNLPNPVYVPIAVGIVIGFNLMTDRMNRSPRLHRFARPMPLLQYIKRGVVTSGDNLTGITRFLPANRSTYSAAGVACRRRTSSLAGSGSRIGW